jgi:hypothetical protein
MVRDTLAIRTTGAGEFICFGQVISALDHHLSPETVH